MKILSSYQKLKQKIVEQDLAYKKLREDFRKYHNGDFQTQTQYGIQFKMEDDTERAMWFGDSAYKKDI